MHQNYNKMEKEENKTSNIWGIASLVTSIISLLGVLMPYLALPLAIFAIVAHNKQKAIKPTSISMSGFVIGIISVILNSMMFIFLGIYILIVGSL